MTATWIVGLFTVNKEEDVYTYVFTGLVIIKVLFIQIIFAFTVFCFQGFAILFFYIILAPKVSDATLRKFHLLVASFLTAY